MSESNSLNFTLKQQKIERIQSLPNDEVGLLEETIGISFGEIKPKKVNMSAGMVAKLVSEQASGNILKAVASLAHFALGKKHTAAEYYPQLDAIVVFQARHLGEVHASEEDCRFTMHENMHAWIARESRDYMESPTAKIKALLKDVKGLKSMDVTELRLIVEEYMLVKIFSEGICDLGSIYTGLMSDKVKNKAVYLAAHLELTDPKADPSVVKNEDWDFFDFNEDKYIEEVREMYKLRDMFVEALMSGNLAEVLVVQNKTTGQWYDLGYKLALTVVEAGMDSNLSVGESFKHAIHKPFQRFSDIIDLDELEELKQK